MRILATITLAVLCVTAGAPVATGETDEAAKKRAKKMLTEGDRLFKKGEFEGALAAYQKAYEAFPSPKIFYPMAQAEEKLGRDLEALQHYEELLKVEELAEEIKTDAGARVDEIFGRIVVVTFVVKPEGTVVSVDDVEIGQAPLPAPVRLLPGTHKFSFALDGFVPIERSVELKPGDKPRQLIKMKRHRAVEPDDPGDEDPVKPRGTVEDPTATRPSSGKGVLLVGLVATGVLAAGATTTGLMAMSKHSTYEDTSRPFAEREDARTSGKSMAVVTDVLIAGTVVAGAFTTYWYISKVKPSAASSERPPGTARVWTPYVTPEGGGIVVLGRF